MPTVLECGGGACTAFRLGKYVWSLNLDDERRALPLRSGASGERAGAHASGRCAADGGGPQGSIANDSNASSEPGSRYIDFLIPGLLGMNLMNSGMWGIGFALVDMRQRKLLKRFVATPMRRTDFLLALVSSRLVLMLIEVGLLLASAFLFFHVRVEGSMLSILLVARWSDFVWRHRVADGQPGAENRKRQRPDQPGDDAHVDLLRCVLLL